MDAIIRPEFQGNGMIVLNRVSRSGQKTAFVFLSGMCVCERGPALFDNIVSKWFIHYS